MADSRELDIVVLEDDHDSTPSSRVDSIAKPSSPSRSEVKIGRGSAVGANQSLSADDRHVSLDVESQTHYGELDLIKERAQSHRKGHGKTFGRVHLVEQADAIDEVERALELEEVRDTVLGRPHSRANSLHHVHFQLTGSQEERVREKEDNGEITSEERPEDAKPDILGAIFNLMNYALGAGILALPYAFRQAGLLVGALMVAVVGAATIFSMMLLLGASKATDTYGYEQLARSSYGDKFAQFVKITIIVDSFGALSAYMILVAETTTELASNYLGSNTIWSNKILVLTLVTVFIMFPLCCLKNINYLGFTSALSLIPQVYFLVLIVYYMAKAGGIQAGLKFFNSGFFYALPIIIFSFSSQQALFPLYTELQERNGTEKDIKRVAMISIGLTAVCYLFSGTIGVMAYPTNAKGNVLSNFPEGIVVDILLFTTAVSTILSFPVILWPARVSTDRLLFLDRPPSYLRFILEAAAILALSFLIAIAIPSFSTVLGLFGSLTNTCIGYVLPPLYYLKLHPTPLKDSYMKKLAIALLIGGSLLGLIAAGIITQDYISSLLKGSNPEGS